MMPGTVFRSLWIEYRRPWKLGTLLMGVGLLVAGSFYYRAPDWDVTISLIMAFFAYLTAPWSLRVVVERRWRYVPLALFSTWFSVDGCYWLYWRARNPVALALMRDANFPASLSLYVMCGLVWYYNGSLRQWLADARAWVAGLAEAGDKGARVGPAIMDSHTMKTYQPTNLTRFWACVFTLPGTVMFAWVGLVMLFQGIPWGVLFIVASVLLLVWVLFLTTSRVTITQEKLVRTWWLGSRDMPVSQIDRMTWNSARGQKMLLIRAGNRRILLSSLSFKERELADIHARILAMTEGVVSGANAIRG